MKWNEMNCVIIFHWIHWKKRVPFMKSNPWVSNDEFIVDYSESRKRELKTRPTYECRCDERLKTKDEKSNVTTAGGKWRKKTIANSIVKKGTRGSFQLWGKDDHDLAVTIIQKPRALGGFGLTPNVIAQTSDKVTMTPRFLGLVRSLPLDEQQLWFPNQQVHDPYSWTVPHLLQLKMENDVQMTK
jgi:hypothetical protein